jgi:SAM-dependent methyltransferase
LAGARDLTLPDVYRLVPRDGEVLDVGCFGFRQVQIAADAGMPALRHAGVDFVPEADPPAGYDYRHADLNTDPLPFEDDRFDLVVCSHVLEHIADPLRFFAECVRVAKPGGLVFVETPSERSLWLPGFPFSPEKFYSLSFFDDPTHVGRPWSAQGLYRLASYFGCEPLGAGYRSSWKARLALPFLLPLAMLDRRGKVVEQLVWNAVGWASFLVARKSQGTRGAPQLSYDIPADRDRT